MSVLRHSIDQPGCFAVLFDRHFAQVHRYLGRRLGDELAAEPAAGTSLQPFRSRGRFAGEEASVLAWLCGIATNLVRMNHRTASPVLVRPMPTRYYCVHTGISQPNVLRIPCDRRFPNGYVRLTGVAGWIREGSRYVAVTDAFLELPSLPP